MSEQLQYIIEATEKEGHTLKVISAVKSGKEAEVYQVLLDNVLSAMKVYKNPEERSFKNADQYLSGKYYKTKSHQKAISKGNKFGKKLKHSNWIAREFLILKKLHTAGAAIPKPILQVQDAVIMEFVGNEEECARRLIDIDPNKKMAEIIFQNILENIKLFWKNGIVHGDLSAYNILYWDEKAFIIDFPQCIDTRNYPNPWEVLERDLNNIINYFKKYIAMDEDKVKEEFKNLTK